MGLCYESKGGDNSTAVLAAYSQNYMLSGERSPLPHPPSPPPPYLLSPLPHPECSSQWMHHPVTPGLTSMRHMPPAVYKLGVHLWRASYKRLPRCCRVRPPNQCILQTYRRSKRDFMDYHTDARAVNYGDDDDVVQVRRATSRIVLHASPRVHRCCLPLTGPGQRRHHLHHR